MNNNSKVSYAAQLVISIAYTERFLFFVSLFGLGNLENETTTDDGGSSTFLHLCWDRTLARHPANIDEENFFSLSRSTHFFGSQTSPWRWIHTFLFLLSNPVSNRKTHEGFTQWKNMLHYAECQCSTHRRCWTIDTKQPRAALTRVTAARGRTN